jgi:hypothetical protein
MNIEKQTTAMQDHIATIDGCIEYVKNNQNGTDESKGNLITVFNELKKLAISQLSKERTQIENAYTKGFGDTLFDVSENSSSASEYFTETFK